MTFLLLVKKFIQYNCKEENHQRKKKIITTNSIDIVSYCLILPFIVIYSVPNT